ncbi:MAG TPA: HlyD family efflux transporter periplasmic adaptor subunit [Stellaceae bacterium]
MSARQLFRQEAIEFQRGQREFGDIALLQPVSTKLLVWLLTGAVTIAIVFLCFAQFSRKQTVSGFLIPAAGTLKVFPTREGVVTAVYVTEGQQVKAGDPLFAVATPEIAADGEDVNAAKLAALKQQKGALGQQIGGEQKNAAAERDRLTALVASTQQQIGNLRSQIDIQAQRVQLSETLVGAAKELLAKGYMSAVEGKRREDAVLEHRQTLASLQRQLSEQQGKLAEAQYSLKELPTATARKIQPLRDQISEIDQRSADSKGRGSYVVRAPGTGRVSMLQVGKGQTAQLQHLQLEIVPDGAPLQAELLIPTRAAGFVRVGEEVRFLYDAFPYQNFGAYTGHIAELANTVLTKADTAGPITPEEPVYKAIAMLDRPDVDANGKQMPLHAGMLLKAEVILDRRSLASWILDPLLHKRF